MDNRLAASSERFLRNHAGRSFCDSCLAIGVGLSLQQAAEAVAALGAFADFAVGPAVCLSCSRTKTVIGAKAA